ncbi:MAG: RelA/SpoT family protein [Patescibacteria group bacterium]
MTTWEEYKEKLPKEYPPSDMALIKRAFNFAREIHKDEKRLTEGPFVDHPIAVSLDIAKAGFGATTIATALLHDTYETDEKAIKNIRKEFGQEIVFLVKGLSKVQKAKYYGAERTAESTRKMFMAMAQDIRVIIIKLFDRLDNLGTLHVLPEKKQKRIAIETLEIYAPIADRLGMSDVKLKLEDEAFKYAYPEEYAWIINETREKIPEREKYLVEKVIPSLSKELTGKNIKTKSIHYRAKHYHSLWKKLLRNNMDWYMIYDLIAIRIIVESVEDCYAILGVIHKLWKPLPGRIKDYISLPKQNGYQSLHTTVFCIDNKVTEFQIRTGKMHEEAEQGIAAHWAWEMAGKPKQVRSLSAQKFAWVNQLKNWHKKFNENNTGDEFIKTLKIDFFKDRVFVLTPTGDVLDLPEGATPIDFAYNIHSKIGDSITGAKVNNHIVPLSYQLNSGDMVEILTQKNKKPNQKILMHAKTSMARNHIKSALRKQNSLSKFGKQKDKPKTELILIVNDRVGLIKDVGVVLALYKINVQSMVTKETDHSFASISIIFSSKNKKQVDKVATRLKTIGGIEEVKIKY